MTEYSEKDLKKDVDVLLVVSGRVDFAETDFGSATDQVAWFKIDIHLPPVIRQVTIDYPRNLQ